MRRFSRRHSWLTFTVRSFMIFSAAFGGSYGFIAGSRSENSGYDPNAFAIGASFLFAVACVALATLSFRLRMMRMKLRKIALHNEALADRNWELQEAEQRARSLFESQGDLIVLRDAEGRITFVNDAYCELARQPRRALIGSRFTFTVLEQGDTALEPNGTRIHDQKIAGPLGPAMDRLARGPGSIGCRPAGRNAMRRPRRHRPHRDRTRAGRGPRPGRRRQPRQVALPRDGQPRNPHAAERHPRHERLAAGYAADAGADDLRQGGEDLGRRAAVADRGTAGLFQDRGRQDRSRTSPVRARRTDRGHHRTAGAAGAGAKARDRCLCRRAAAGAKWSATPRGCGRCCSIWPATPSSSPRPAAWR